jgi:hypothetical protein
MGQEDIMPLKDQARAWAAKFQKVQKQPSSQTMKANAVPHMGQQAMKPGKSPLQKYMAGTRKKHVLDTPSYNVGRTKRC